VVMRKITRNKNVCTFCAEACREAPITAQKQAKTIASTMATHGRLQRFRIFGSFVAMEDCPLLSLPIRSPRDPPIKAPIKVPCVKRKATRLSWLTLRPGPTGIIEMSTCHVVDSDNAMRGLIKSASKCQ
jgi:hypothetical protein